MIPGWTWAPGQWAREPDGCTVLVDGVDEHGRPMASGVVLVDVVPDPDGVGMGDWALAQVPRARVDGWTPGCSWRLDAVMCAADETPTEWTEVTTFVGPTLYAACEAVARARGGWGR